jgi:outer membrane receptor protein involved in Fe transport
MVEGFRLHRYSDANLLGPICFCRGKAPPTWQTERLYTTFDISAGKAVAESLTLSLTALNLTNRRFLLDNGATFGGTHYAESRQIYLQIRYRFRM